MTKPPSAVSAPVKLEMLSVVTGDRESHPHRLDDYAAYFRAAKRRLSGWLSDHDRER